MSTPVTTIMITNVHYDPRRDGGTISLTSRVDETFNSAFRCVTAVRKSYQDAMHKGTMIRWSESYGDTRSRPCTGHRCTLRVRHGHPTAFRHTFEGEGANGTRFTDSVWVFYR